MSISDKKNEENYPPVEFEYFEYDLKAECAEDKFDKYENEENCSFKRWYPVVLLLGGLVIGGIAGGLFGRNLGLRETDETFDVPTTETTVMDISEEDYSEKLCQYIQKLYPQTVIARNNGSGQYDVGNYIISDLDCDGVYPEALSVIRDEENSGYFLITYSYAEDGSEEIIYHKNALDEIEDFAGTAEGVIINQRTDNGSFDIIVIGRSSTGGYFSDFLRYEDGTYYSMGIIDGIPERRNEWEKDGQSYCSYDMAGIYRIGKEYTGKNKIRAYQDWTVDESGYMKAVMSTANETGLAQNFWNLEEMPAWYLKRPVLAYIPDFQFDSLQVLYGEWIRVTGVWECGGRNYYQIETDEGESGLILLSNIMNQDICQVELQNLPFSEVFSETIAENQIGDLVLPVEEIITEPKKVVLETEGSYEAWIDLNGDGTWEKISFERQYNPGYEGTKIRLMLNDIVIINEIFIGKAEEIALLIIDMDETDRWMEIGYRYSGNNYAETALYRYDGISVRNLGLENALMQGGGGTPQWFSQDTGEPAWKEGEVAVKRHESVSQKVVYYYIKYDTVTGMFIRESFIRCWLEIPVSGHVSMTESLYESPEGGNLVGTVEEGDGIIFDEFFIYVIENEFYYRGHFICENGLEGYSGLMDKETINTVFGLEDFFGFWSSAG